MANTSEDQLYNVGDKVNVIQYKGDKPFKTYTGKVSLIITSKECGDFAPRITSVSYRIDYDGAAGPMTVSDNKDPEKPSMQRLENKVIT